MRQFAAQRRDERGGRRMFLLERNQDLAIHRADGRRVAQGDVDAAVGQTDVVEHRVDLVGADDLADRAFDLGEIASGFPPDPRAGGARTCSRIWPASTCGKEILPELRETAAAKRTISKARKKSAGDRGPRHAVREAVAIAFAETLETALRSRDEYALKMLKRTVAAAATAVIVPRRAPRPTSASDT